MTTIIRPGDDLRAKMAAGKPGDTFILMPGEYRITRGIALPPGGRIEGA